MRNGSPLAATTSLTLRLNKTCPSPIKLDFPSGLSNFPASWLPGRMCLSVLYVYSSLLILLIPPRISSLLSFFLFREMVSVTGDYKMLFCARKAAWEFQCNQVRHFA